MLLCSQQTVRVAYFQQGQERGQEALREGTWEREKDLAAESVKEVPYPHVPPYKQLKQRGNEEEGACFRVLISQASRAKRTSQVGLELGLRRPRSWEGSETEGNTRGGAFGSGEHVDCRTQAGYKVWTWVWRPHIGMS